MSLRRTRHGGLKQAIDAAGSVASLASKLSLTLQAVAQWDTVPAKRCLDVERLTGVSRHVLRPDIYGEQAPRKSRPGNDRVAA